MSDQSGGQPPAQAEALTEAEERDALQSVDEGPTSGAARPDATPEKPVLEPD